MTFLERVQLQRAAAEVVREASRLQELRLRAPCPLCGGTMAGEAPQARRCVDCRRAKRPVTRCARGCGRFVTANEQHFWDPRLRNVCAACRPAAKADLVAGSAAA